MVTTAELLQLRSRHQSTGLTDAEITAHLKAVEGWQLEDGHIVKTFRFKDYHQTMAFVNAMAELIHAEDHHPELIVTYNRCTVKFNTHSVNNGNGGLSVNDFICAAKIDMLFRQSFTGT